jgi:hypothetical protein
MSNVLTSPPANGSIASLQRRKRMMTTVLWITQGCLALLFLLAGGVKLVLPIGIIMAQMPLPLPGLFLRFIGFVEVAGAMGLILPGLFRIRPMLTPLAACGLLIEMIGAMGVTFLRGEGTAALLPMVVGLLCAAVAYGRRSWR